MGASQCGTLRGGRRERADGDRLESRLRRRARDPRRGPRVRGAHGGRACRTPGSHATDAGTDHARSPTHSSVPEAGGSGALDRGASQGGIARAHLSPAAVAGTPPRYFAFGEGTPRYGVFSFPPLVHVVVIPPDGARGGQPPQGGATWRRRRSGATRSASRAART